MTDRLLSTRELLAWVACFLGLAILLIWTGFTSTDPDSALYAGLADRLAQEPGSRWLAPEWWGFWPEAQMTGLFREHPAGVLLIPAALARLGVPALQGAYIVGTAAGLASLLMMATLIKKFATREEARIALVLLQLMPVAFIFRIRANHEYPMLVCLLVTLLGLASASSGRRLWLAVVLVSAGLTGGLFVKGVFVAQILLAIVVWVAANPLGGQGARRRCVLVGAAGLVAMALGAFAYDASYRAATGEPFWSLYWARQVGPLMEYTTADLLSTSMRNVLFYLSRLVWHPAPWSLALVVAAWKRRDDFRERWIAVPERTRRGLTFALSFAALAILVLAPSSRFAERYAFSATHAIACAGVVAACSMWSGFTSRVASLDRRVPALPALVWLSLALLRLGVGSVR